MLTALLAAAHIFVLPWKMLFLLPVESEKPCGVTSLRYGPPDGKWEQGANPPASKCEFHVMVKPGPLLPVWSDLPSQPADELDVTYTVQGSQKPQVASAVKPQKIEPAAAQSGDLSAKTSKAKSRVRVEVANKSQQTLLVGDAVAARSKPGDSCVGPGPAAVLLPGETLVDTRPGLLSPSMKVYVAVFTGEKQCRWVEVAPRK